MVSIHEIIKSATGLEGEQNNDKNSSTRKNQKIALVLDVSGSTGARFGNTGLTVLEKEIECMTMFVLENPDNSYVLYSFESSVYYHGPVSVLKDEDLVVLPDFRPLGGTSTHLALDEICNKLDTFKPDSVIVYTDGQTGSSLNYFQKSMKNFKDYNIKFEVVAVTCTDKNMETITQNEERSIPGMELVNGLGNSIDSLNIYNLFHKNSPFVGILNTSTDKKSLRFMGFKLNDIIPVFIEKLLSTIDSKKEEIDWGQGQLQLKKFIAEIGKLLSIFFVELPINHPMIIKFTTKLSFYMNSERVLKILEYGFNCSKQNKPILFTNFEEHVKDSVLKKNEFSDAISELNNKGTTLGSNKRITIPCGNNPVCILDHGSVQMTSNLDSYPKSCDQYGNVYFGVDVNPQAIRIAMRTYCGKLGFQNARYSNSVPFFVLSQMAIMYIKGEDLNSEHMKTLRELAIYQTSLEVVVAKNKYDGLGCYNYWKTGKLLAMHYEKPGLTHTSVYSDKQVNQLGLSEPFWWALMMSMLGLFEEQKVVYKQSIEALGIDCQLSSFLSYIKDTYSQNINGNIVYETLSEVKKSLFTLDYFEENDEVYVLKDHSSNGGNVNNCCTKTHYSKEEMDYVNKNGCVWCQYIPKPEDYEKVVNKDTQKVLLDAVKKSSKITFTGIKKMQADYKKVRINMCGITGSGKTTSTEKLKKILKDNGFEVLVVSSDELSKNGITGKQMQSTIFNNIKSFENLTNKFKAVIMDLCNEKGVQTNSFGWDFSEYTDLIFYPNFDQKNNLHNFDEYEAWCLSNVISRKMHSKTTNYWLNPVSAGIDTCINVHNMKANGVALLVRCNRQQVPKMNQEQLVKWLKPKADSYTQYLKSKNLDEEILKFLVDNDVIEKSENKKDNETKTQNVLNASIQNMKISGSSPVVPVAQVVTKASVTSNTDDLVDFSDEKLTKTQKKKNLDK